MIGRAWNHPLLMPTVTAVALAYWLGTAESVSDLVWAALWLLGLVKGDRA